MKPLSQRSEHCGIMSSEARLTGAQGSPAPRSHGLPVPSANKLPDAIRAKLAARNFWVFSTVHPDGSPTGTPLWVHIDGDQILVNTGIGRQKERNVRRERRCALTLIERDDPYSWVEIRGRVVELVEGDEAEASFLAMARKYLGSETYATPTPGESRVLLRIEATHIHWRTEPRGTPASLSATSRESAEG